MKQLLENWDKFINEQNKPPLDEYNIIIGIGKVLEDKIDPKSIYDFIHLKKRPAWANKYLSRLPQKVFKQYAQVGKRWTVEKYEEVQRIQPTDPNAPTTKTSSFVYKWEKS